MIVFTCVCVHACILPKSNIFSDFYLCQTVKIMKSRCVLLDLVLQSFFFFLVKFNL